MGAVTPATVTEEVEVTGELVATLLDAGGFVHPLFAASNPDRPLPGQGVLLLMGGMLERSGALDHAIAMVGLEDVRFRTMVRAGDRIRAELEPRAARTTSGGSRIETFGCVVHNQQDRVVLEATVKMLVQPPETRHRDVQGGPAGAGPSTREEERCE